ncbi:CidA/LrgA family protein [Alkalilimnicola sp. S0819]|uniref:CidA/LrgA family protein n=1 Tax=Alkalilimnicola sp. S0819 TaxID=2613922 RepID=UPI001261835F|nr:CidA/LrgA family protein [Alkalilimnicola sp. S0819]KAB7623339.1 CidA/LrgA family protein [Alkalilimnicola sp. S0819]MPQ16878.1 CidA/LrgA family protein [Alkalilimnicola sp. S0819]
MLLGLTLILACQLAGELLSQLLQLPVPGPVLGMVILLIALLLHGRVPAGVRVVAENLLRYLPLLFVPAGVGLVVHGSRLAADGWAIAAAIIGSTVLALLVTAAVLSWLTRGARHEQ